MSSKPPPIRIFRTRRLLDTEFIRVDEHRLSYRLANGEWSPLETRLSVDRGNSVAAILFEPETRLLHFVRQFRYATYDFSSEPDPENGWLIELVAGGVKPGEPLRAAIEREVKEETGFEIAEPRLIGSFYLSPGAYSERLYLFYAEVTSARRATPQRNGSYGVDGEDINTVSMTLSDFLARVERLEIQDAKTIAAAEWLRRNPRA
jgi:nudix-type nucleoside diphosphatase (YffH/AdpP family)